MHIDDCFIGREREVAQLDISIGPGRDGLRLAMLSGPSGLGKTTLSRVAADRARERGFRVATVHGRAGSLSTPFAPFIEAMPEFEVLLSVLAGDRSIDIEHAGIGLVNLLAELTLDQPLLIVFDDAQALDESSIALLPYLVGVSERMDLTLFFVEQTDAVDVPSSYRAFIDGVLARRVVNHLQLGPMSDESIGELVAHVLQLANRSDVPDEIVTRAGGNPWFAKELAESFRRGNTEIPTNIAAAATARLHSLGETGQDVVYAVAICPEGAHIGWLEAMSGERPRQFVRLMETIERSGLVREDGDVITIAHPLMQQALIGELSVAMRRAIHLELAEVISTLHISEVVSARAQGFHLAQAGRSTEAVEFYLRSATANEVNGQLHEAYADLQRALATESRVDDRAKLLTRCATTAMQLGVPSAIEHWTELGRVAASNGDDELYAYSLCQQYWASGDGTMLERLQRAATLGPSHIGWSARAAACLSMLDGDYSGVVEHDRRALEIARERGDTVLEALALEGCSIGAAHFGDIAASIEFQSQAVAVGIRERLHGFVVNSWYGLSESLAEGLETGRSFDEAASAVRYVDDLGLDRYRAVLLTQLGRASMRVGDLETARRTATDVSLAHAAGSPERYDSLVHLFLAEIEVECGDLVRATDLVDAAIRLTSTQRFYSWRLDAQVERVRLLLRSGSFDQAYDVAASLQVDEEVVAASLAISLARCAVQNDRADLAKLASDLMPTGSTIPLVRQQAIELAAIQSGDESALRSAADGWTDAGRPLDAARVQSLVAQQLSAAGKRTEAIALFKEVRASFLAMGALTDADLVASKLRGLGTRSRAKSRESAVGNLTRRELEIARLVASGMRNSEVAGHLFLSEKTVAAHLSNIYGKLEVRSRVKLTAWIRENDLEFSSSVAV